MPMHTMTTADLPDRHEESRQPSWGHAPLVCAILFAVACCAAPSALGQSADEGPEPGEIVRDCPDCGELVVVPTGTFDMGSNEVQYERPVHRVTIKTSFAIGRREVTFDEWDACASAGGCKHRP